MKNSLVNWMRYDGIRALLFLIEDQVKSNLYGMQQHAADWTPDEDR
ncbi:MAG: hypothetical protein ABFS45_03120 [Pseudomonadota bacterium]